MTYRNYGIGSKADHNPDHYKFSREQSRQMKDAEWADAEQSWGSWRHWIAFAIMAACWLIAGLYLRG